MDVFDLSGKLSLTGANEATSSLERVTQVAEGATAAITGTEQATSAAGAATAQMGQGFAAVSTQGKDLLAVIADITGRMNEAREALTQGKLTQEQYAKAIQGLRDDLQDYMATTALTEAEQRGLTALQGELATAMNKGAGSVSAATLAMRGLQTGLAEAKAAFKEGAITEAQYEARLVELNAALKSLPQTYNLTTAEQARYNTLLQQTTVSNRLATQQLDVIRNALVQLQAAHRSGRVSLWEYHEGLRTLNADLRELAQTEALTAAEQRTYNTLLTQTTPRAAEAARGLGTVRSALSTVAAQALGATGPVGSLLSGLSQFVAGSTLAVGVVAGVAAVTLAYRVLTSQSREVQQENEKLADSFFHQSEAADTLARAIRGVDAALTEAERHKDNADFWQTLFHGATARGNGLIALIAGHFAGKESRAAANDDAAARQAAKDATRETFAAYAEAVRLGTASELQRRQVLAYIVALKAQAEDEHRTLAERNAAAKEAEALTSAMEKGAKSAAKAQREWVTSLADQVGLYKELANVQGLRPEDQLALFQALQQVNSALEQTNLTLRERITLLRASGEASGMLFQPSGIVEHMNGQLPLKGKEWQRLMDEPLKLVNGRAPKPSDFEQLEKGFAQSIATSIGNGIAAGFDALFASGDIGAGFGALTATLLTGLGSAAEQFGVASLAIAISMESIFNALASFLPGAAIGASIAMIAIGAALKAAGNAASKAFSPGSSALRGSGGTGGTGGQAEAQTTRIVVQPAGVAQASAVKPRPHVNALFLSPKDQTWTRLLQESLDALDDRKGS